MLNIYLVEHQKKTTEQNFAINIFEKPFYF